MVNLFSVNILKKINNHNKKIETDLMCYLLQDN